MFWTLANTLTISRILIAPVFAAIILDLSPGKDHLRYVALAVFLFAVLLDFMDGYIARRFEQISKIGAILDPIADKILLITAFISLYAFSSSFRSVRLPQWFLIAVVCRDVFLLSGVVIIKMVRGVVVFKVTDLGKLTMVFQVLVVVAVLIQLPFAFVIWYAAAILLGLSSFDYLMKGIDQIQQE